MIKNPIIITILIQFLTPTLQSQQHCDPAHCNHEGQCIIENGVQTCHCIGDNYFQGPRCTEILDNCLSTSCHNGGQCQNLVGQFMCRDCQQGYGGLWCDVEMQNVLENIALYFNHYGHYSQSQHFIIIVEQLGSVPFSVELVGDNYVIDSFETRNTRNYKTHWTYSSDLATIIKKKGIRYHNDLPFEVGYYHMAEETFWNLGTLKLTLRIYDTETASALFYLQVFDILILKPEAMACVPQLKFMHGSNPTEPLMVDIARFNNFDALVLHRCAPSSGIFFEWRAFNSIGNKMLHNFGNTRVPLLKVAPYTLWFNYHGEVMSSYSLVVTMIEHSNSVHPTHEARCFILVLPKPVKAAIKGGPYREVSIKQPLILDGSASRDYALAPLAKQNLTYRWDCASTDDVHNRICRPNISTGSTIEIKANWLKLSATYNFTLVVQSKVNIFISDETRQHVVVIENIQLFPHIKCVRNCLRKQFNGDNIIHLAIQCDLKEGECPRNAKFSWTINGVAFGNDRRCLYRPQELDFSLIFTAEVWNKGLGGKASMELTRNLPPVEGSCSIEPTHGEAFETEFHIKCMDFLDSDAPLIYQYIAGDFPLERINDPEAVVVLPQSHVITIVICDQLDACVETRLDVNVSVLPEPTTLGPFLSNINDLITRGHNLDAMILVKSLLKYINSEARALELIKHLGSLTPLTLLQVEQWLNICHHFTKNLLPLNNRKTIPLNGFLIKLSRGLQIVIDDREILDMQDKGFERSLAVIGDIMKELAQPWETIADVHTLQSQILKTIDPLAEHYTQLPEFDIFILERIANWLQTSRQLHKCFDLLSLQATHIYCPQETPFSVEDELFRMKVYAIEETTEQHINIGNQSIELELPHDVIEDLQGQLHSKPIVLQVVSMKSNPFWWYPDGRYITTNVFYLSAFSENSSPQMKPHLSMPFTSKFHLRRPEIQTTIPAIEGVITDSLHMPVFVLSLPANAAVIVWLQKTAMDVLLEVGIGQKPRSFQVRKSKQIFRKNNTFPMQQYVATNSDSQTREAYIAVLATEEANKFPFTFQLHLSTVECLYWDWDLMDPQWSSKGCRPNFNSNGSQVLQCDCDHMSAFAAKTYPSAVIEDLGDHCLLDALPFNWYMVNFYFVIFAIAAVILTCNFHRSLNNNDILLSDANNENRDVEVCIYTGSHWNSSSSANIQLRFISKSGPYSVTIYQSAQKPQLQRNSLCKLRLSSHNVSLPLKLTITNDQSGRYPSWYCHQISVINQATNQLQLFTIDQWISKQPLEVASSRSDPMLKQRFGENLVNFYINWFQFQPIFGPVLYSDKCCFQRSCVWVSQFMVSLCIVACYHGPTTMDTYEEEREQFYSLNFNMAELCLLPLICFLSSVFIKWSFSYLCPSSEE